MTLLELLNDRLLMEAKGSPKLGTDAGIMRQFQFSTRVGGGLGAAAGRQASRAFNSKIEQTGRYDIPAKYAPKRSQRVALKVMSYMPKSVSKHAWRRIAPRIEQAAEDAGRAIGTEVGHGVRIQGGVTKSAGGKKNVYYNVGGRY